MKERSATCHPERRRRRRTPSAARKTVTLAPFLLTCCTLERVGKQQLLNPGTDAIYRDRHYSQAVRVLAGGGASMDDVVELTTFHTDMSEFQRFEKVKDEFFPRNYPAVGVNGWFHHGRRWRCGRWR
jgi:hypothetical protein